MKLKAGQLAAQINKSLAPIYLLTGDEPLQMRECTDLIRAAARQQAYQERIVLHVEAGFDWSYFEAEANSLSLFASRRLLELHFANHTPNDAGTKTLQRYAEQVPPETVLLITADKLDGQKQKTKWFTALEQVGVVVQLWPIELAQLPQWVEQRARALGLKITPTAIELIAERSEGHLLACAQELEKLQLLHPDTVIDMPQVLDAVADSARFEVFGWVETVLKGEAQRSARQLDNLRTEGQEPFFVCWALQQELRTLAQVSFALQHGQTQEQVFKNFRVWSFRQAVVKRALSRFPTLAWQRFLHQSIKIDKMIKGLEKGNPWDELQRLSLFIAGVRVLGR